MQTLNLPVSLKDGGRRVEVKRERVGTLLAFNDEIEGGRRWNAVLELLDGNVFVDGEPVSPNVLRHSPREAIIPIVIAVFRLFNVQTKMEGVYPCPRPGCNYQIIREETRKTDNRDDIKELKTNVAPEDYAGRHRIDLGDDIISLRDPEGEILVQALILRDPTLDDMIRLEEDASLKKSSRRMKRLIRYCLVGLDTTRTELEASEIINKYSRDLLQLKDDSIYNRIAGLWSLYGIVWEVPCVCRACTKEWEADIDMWSFFGYALRLWSVTARTESYAGTS